MGTSVYIGNGIRVCSGIVVLVSPGVRIEKFRMLMHYGDYYNVQLLKQEIGDNHSLKNSRKRKEERIAEHNQKRHCSKNNANDNDQWRDIIGTDESMDVTSDDEDHYQMCVLKIENESFVGTEIVRPLMYYKI
ncbi:hypothetical protein C5167_014563 [Papaver somniferum]|uniref:Uncharacterized protein n=1 Tax=Papaver somniferum TaxID=3469 RepID=A0A4Y7J3J0_PAPSO|nr:hypothetical protein C5167_014563 [Papaver somniferum]